MTNFERSDQIRRTTSAVMTSLTALCTFVAIGILVIILSYIAWQGIASLSFRFLVDSPRPVGEGGGIGNAILGSVVLLTLSSAFGLPFGITETIFVLGWSLVGSLVPTPGGAAGAFHAATAAGLILLGISRETAAAISIVLHIVDFGPALIFGVYYIIRGDINLSRLRAMTSSESVEHAVEDEPILADKLYVPAELNTAAARD